MTTNERANMTTDTLGSGRRLAAIILELDGLKQRLKELPKLMRDDTVAQLDDARKATRERVAQIWARAIEESKQCGQIVMEQK